MKPFDKVLVRSAEYGLWMPALYGKEKDGLYITSAGWQKYCIPYEGNENLLGTKNEVDQTSQEQRIEKLIEELDRQYFGLESLTAADVKEIIRRSFFEGCKG